jgi:hypothetical protein
MARFWGTTVSWARSSVVLFLLILSASCPSGVGCQEGAPPVPVCSRGKGIAKVTLNLVDQFVRLDVLRVESLDVVEALISILNQDHPNCEARYVTAEQLMRLARTLKFTDLTADDVVSLARNGEVERLQQLAQASGTAEPNNNVMQDYADALEADGMNHVLRLEFGRIRAQDENREIAMAGIKDIWAAVSSLETQSGNQQAADAGRLDLALALHSVADYDSALSHFAQLISTEPRRIVVWYLASRSFQAGAASNPGSKRMGDDARRSKQVLSRLEIEMEHSTRPLAVQKEHDPKTDGTIHDRARHHSLEHGLERERGEAQPVSGVGMPSMREIISQYQRMRDVWQSEQGPSPGTRRFLVYTPGTEGWGNRMLVLASMVLMAIQTERELVVDWHGAVPLDQALDHTLSNWLPDHQNSKPWQEIEHICKGEGRLWNMSDPDVTCGGKKDVEHCGCGRAANMGSRNAQWLFHHPSSTLVLYNPMAFFTPAMRDLLHANSRSTWGSNSIPVSRGGPQVIWYQGLGSFILAQAQLSSYNWAWQVCGIPHGEQVPMAGCILREVVKPGPLVQAEIDKIMGQVARSGNKLIALALRRGNRAKDGVGIIPDGQQKDSYSYLQRSGEFAFLACAINMISRLQAFGRKVVVFLATDDPELLSEVRQALPPRADIVHNAPSKTPWLSMLVDWFMLGSTDDAVLTDGSTFGLTAFSRNSVNGFWPVSVRQGDMNCHRRSQQTEVMPLWMR